VSSRQLFGSGAGNQTVHWRPNPRRDGWLDLTSEKGRKELAALRLVESSP
jgi:hypothetical protein